MPALLFALQIKLTMVSHSPAQNYTANYLIRLCAVQENTFSAVMEPFFFIKESSKITFEYSFMAAEGFLTIKENYSTAQYTSSIIKQTSSAAKKRSSVTNERSSATKVQILQA